MSKLSAYACVSIIVSWSRRRLPMTVSRLCADPDKIAGLGLTAIPPTPTRTYLSAVC
jgi:hypothetical protein